MNSKTLLFGMVAAVGGFLAWRWMNSAQTGVFSAVPNVGQGTFSTQPSNVYPYQANEPPRVDNSNQPWYGGDRSGLMAGNPQLQGLASTAMDAKSISTIIDSAKSIWDDLGIGTWLDSGEPGDSTIDVPLMAGGSNIGTASGSGYLGSFDWGF